MKGLLIIILFCVTSLGVYSQRILVIENFYSLKNFKFYTEDEITIRVTGIEKRVTDRIADITDSSVVFEIMGEIDYSRVEILYRENWLIQIVRGLSLLGGLAYFGIDSFNRLINHEAPVIDQGTAMISGGLVAVSLILTPLKYRKIKIGDKWHIKAIDMDAPF